MAENELFDAAARNDARTLQELLVSDPLLLDRVSFTCTNKTPLHVATKKGNLAFVQENLNINHELAEELDSQQSSPLHIASAKGYVDIVRILLEAAPDMCLSRDCQDKNPLHLAAMKGHVHVVEELVRARPLAAGEKLDRGENVLHLCVKHNQLESLRTLVQNLNNEVVINATDDDGDTILHLAVREKQIETIKYFVDSKKIDLHAKDSKGLTALEILEQTPTETTNIEILKVVRSGFGTLQLQENSNSTSQVAYQKTRCHNGGGNSHSNNGIPSWCKPSRRCLGGRFASRFTRQTAAETDPHLGAPSRRCLGGRFASRFTRQTAAETDPH